MSQENVDAFTRGVDAINRGDVEALLDVLDPEIEWHSAILIGLGGDEAVYRGHEGIRQFVGDLYETLAGVPAEYSEIRDLGDRLVALGRIRARGKVSGAEIESPIGSVVELKNGKAIRVWTFLDHNEALDAAGLSK